MKYSPDNVYVSVGVLFKHFINYVCFSKTLRRNYLNYFNNNILQWINRFGLASSWRN